MTVLVGTGLLVMTVFSGATVPHCWFKHIFVGGQTTKELSQMGISRMMVVVATNNGSLVSLVVTKLHICY